MDLRLKGNAAVGERDAGATSFWTPERIEKADPSFEDPFAGSGSFDKRAFSQTGGMTLTQVLSKLGGDETMSRPYVQSAWINACINAISRAVTSVPLRVHASEDERAEVIGSNESALARLFSRPNPLLTRRKLFKTQSIFHYLDGEVMWFLIDKNGNPVSDSTLLTERINLPEEFWVVRGRAVEVLVSDKTKLPEIYRLQTQGETVDFPAASVVHIYEVNPDNPYRGLAPVSAALRSANHDFQAERFDEGILKNGGMPSGVILSDDNVGDPEREKLSQTMHERHGSPDKHRKTLVLPGGFKYESFAFSPQDMEFHQMRDWSRETVMAVFGVTKPILGIVEDVNKSNSQESRRIFWEDTVLPLLRFFEDEINTKLVSRINGPEANQYVRFDTGSVDALRETIDEKVRQIQVLMTSTQRSFKEAAGIVGLGVPVLEGEDDRFIGAGMLPVEMAGDQLKVNQPQPNKSVDDAAKLLKAAIEPEAEVVLPLGCDTWLLSKRAELTLFAEGGMAELRSNMPDHLNFALFRSDGDAERQLLSLLDSDDEKLLGHLSQKEYSTLLFASVRAIMVSLRGTQGTLPNRLRETRKAWRSNISRMANNARNQSNGRKQD